MYLIVWVCLGFVPVKTNSVCSGCHQASALAKFTIDGHSGILRVKPGETLDYETTPTHFVTVVAKVRGHHIFHVHVPGGSRDGNIFTRF